MRKDQFKCAHSPKYQCRWHDFYISLRLIVLLLHERTNTRDLNLHQLRTDLDDELQD